MMIGVGSHELISVVVERVGCTGKVGPMAGVGVERVGHGPLGFSLSCCFFQFS